MSWVIRRLGFDKTLNNAAGEFSSNNACSKAKHIHAVMFNTLSSRISVMAQTSVYAGDLIPRDANTHTRTAECNSSISFTFKPGK